jgi:hypothetical protein
MPPKNRSFRGLSARLCGCLLGLATLGLAVGCVQRRMTIRSNPPGALVYVDDYQIGTTPVSTDFIYYGTRKIRLVKDGYETLTVRQPFPIPWYEIFPLDFVTENLWPWEIRDERIVDLAMSNTVAIPPESVVARAEQARLAAGSLPAPPPVPVVQQPVARVSSAGTSSNSREPVRQSQVSASLFPSVTAERDTGHRVSCRSTEQCNEGALPGRAGGCGVDCGRCHGHGHGHVSSEIH